MARHRGYDGSVIRHGNRLRRLVRGLRDFVDDLAGTSPARLAIGAFCLVVVFFVLLLSLPISYEDPQDRSLADSVFVAVSAVSVTGLTSVETQEYWSDFGVGVIIAGIQMGGLGILTLASLLGMAMSKRLGVRQRMIAAQATGESALGRVGSLLRAVLVTVVTAEAVVALLLLPRFLARGDAWTDALWHSVFYSISSFNNAGFTIHPGGMAYFADDPWILTVIGASVFVGSLGFPAIFIMGIYWNRPRKWDLHTKLTLTTSVVLVLVAFVLQLLFEAGNPRTLGGKNWAQTGLEAMFMAIMPRSGGFATMEMAEMSQATHLVFDILMFIGGGSSSTAGGIKVTTLAVLILAAVAEARGATDATAFGRRIAPGSVRLAVSVLLAGGTTVFLGTLVMLSITDDPLDLVLFEVISAFGTCGLTSGVSGHTSDAGLYVLSALMLVGRLGTITLASALSQRSLIRLYRFPEERPIVG